uniref:Uncharacterized protein n=2 Tax=Tetraselmis sp. GSL018 TaxID=582737 RepID=A0A061SCD3_9CHLO
MSPSYTGMASFFVTRSELKQLVHLHLTDVIIRVWNKHIRDLAASGTPFSSSEELPLYSGTDESTALDFVESMIRKLDGNFAAYYDRFRECAEKLETLYDSKELLELFLEQVKLQEATVGSVHPHEEVSEAQVMVQPNTGKCLLVCSDAAFVGQRVPSVTLNAILRRRQRDPTASEYFVIYYGYVQVTNGTIPDYPDYRFHGTSGFRKDAQTYMSLTDPGDGHCLEGTWNTEWMRGAIVHVEWLERPKAAEDRSLIESYRISSFVDFMKVRTHVGNAAPTTWFVGRPLKDSGRFDIDFLKVVHTTAAAMSAAFAHGGAECKVVMEGITAAQMLQYMRHLSLQVVRNRARQYLSAAFPLNTPLVDDREETLEKNGGNPVTVTDKYEIGKLGVLLASEGGFDKVTFDGAGDAYPSVNVLEQLGRPEAVDLVHRAHERGLITYYSAGFKIQDDSIAKAVLTGTDGVGIGGAQVLRHMDHKTGMHGPYQPENLEVILGLRDKAQATVLGQGVLLLCRLDRMFFEGTIEEAMEPKRQELLKLLQADDEAGVGRVLEECKRVMDMPDDGETPMLGYFRRVLAAESPMIKEQAVMESGLKGWEAVCGKIRILVENEDEDELHDIYMMQPWQGWKDACHEVIFGGAARMRSKLKLGKAMRSMKV